MKASRFCLYFLLACCALFAGSLAAEPAEGPDEETRQLEPVETQAEPQEAAEAEGDVATEDLARAEDSILLDQLFGSFRMILEEASSAHLQDPLAPVTWYQGICVPDFCQPCVADYQCTGGNRCRNMFCP